MRSCRASVRQQQEAEEHRLALLLASADPQCPCRQLQQLLPVAQEGVQVSQVVVLVVVVVLLVTMVVMVVLIWT